MIIDPRRMILALAVLAVSTASALASPPRAVQGGISVTVNGSPVNFSGTGPQMVDGRVLVPLRGIFEALGAAVQWNAADQRINATRGENSVQLQIGNPNATVNGSPVTLDVPARIINGSTMVPIRFVSESMGAQVSWNESQQLVGITASVDQAPAQPAPSGNPGPVRMARISFMDGGVTWRPGDDADWSIAAVNMPIREGAEFWVNPGGRAELQFDDGSVLRLGNGAVAILQTMFSDDSGEFTEIRLNSGTATMRLTNSYSSYQIDTPLASVTASGPAYLRIDDNDGLRLAVRSGEAVAQYGGGGTKLHSGGYLYLPEGGSRWQLSPMPTRDEWDSYWDDRDGMFQRPNPYLPSSLRLVGYDLDSYGTWIIDPQYGRCWRPRVSDPNWGPYRTGHWVWVNPFGWTWCAAEPWGWAPYHYGTWIHTGGGWAWVPGPAQQYWSPAVVHFSTYNGSIAWCALSPTEVHSPAVSLGLRIGDWALNFSIGGAASYYPSNSNYCEPRPWSNAEISHSTNVFNVTNVTNIRAEYVSSNGFVPRNSRIPGGAAMVAAGQFGRGGSANHQAAPNADIFVKGQTFAPPTRGSARYAGPTNVKPTASSFTPAHAFTSARPSAAVIGRRVVRAPLPAGAAAVAKQMPNTRVITRSPARPTLPIRQPTPGLPARRNPARPLPVTPGLPTPPPLARQPNPRRPANPVRPGRPVTPPPVVRQPNPPKPASPVRPARGAPKPPNPAPKPGPKDKKTPPKHDKKPPGG